MAQTHGDTNLPEIAEVVLAVVWPSLGATRAGRLIGRAASLPCGWGVFALGSLLLVLWLPLALAVFFWLRMPYLCRRYMLTTRRVVVVRGLRKTFQHGIALDQFDQIDIEVLPGQQWLRCGELIFRRGQDTLLRLSGVPHPHVFRRSCLNAQQVILATARATQQRQTAAEHARG